MKTFKQTLTENEKQKVYVTFEKDGYGGEQISKVFASKEDAERYIKEPGKFDRVEEHEVE